MRTWQGHSMESARHFSSSPDLQDRRSTFFHPAYCLLCSAIRLGAIRSRRAKIPSEVFTIFAKFQGTVKRNHLLDWHSDRGTAVSFSSFLVRFLFHMGSFDSTEWSSNLVQRLHTDDCCALLPSLRVFVVGCDLSARGMWLLVALPARSAVDRRASTKSC